MPVFPKQLRERVSQSVPPMMFQEPTRQGQRSMVETQPRHPAKGVPLVPAEIAIPQVIEMRTDVRAAASAARSIGARQQFVQRPAGEVADIDQFPRQGAAGRIDDRSEFIEDVSLTPGQLLR